jgi:pyridoxine 5-phosphate synthase|tara:strand:- start:37918 stop:38649 length:732 start_codon:yes stop_codon:yes gene_type:complete
MNDQNDIYLGVNVDHVATVRQARGTDYPSPLEAALVAISSGADSITIHLREDRRHIQLSDLELILDYVSSRINLEMAITSEMLDIAVKLKPTDCCLVPEKREELTTEGGLDVINQIDEVTNACEILTQNRIRPSLFIDPEFSQIEAALSCGVKVIELHTGLYADSINQSDKTSELKRIREAAIFGSSLGLTIHAGHGLNYHNVAEVASITEIVELNIGHSIISRSLFDGMEKAVKDMKKLLKR